MQLPYLNQLFKSSPYYECKSDEELGQLEQQAEERMETAKLTNQALGQKKKILNANVAMAIANLKFWGSEAEAKTKLAKEFGETGKKMGSLAPQYVRGITGGLQADQKAKTRVQELTEKYGNVSRSSYGNSGNSGGSAIVHSPGGSLM